MRSNFSIEFYVDRRGEYSAGAISLGLVVADFFEFDDRIDRATDLTDARSVPSFATAMY